MQQPILPIIIKQENAMPERERSLTDAANIARNNLTKYGWTMMRDIWLGRDSRLADFGELPEGVERLFMGEEVTPTQLGDGSYVHRQDYFLYDKNRVRAEIISGENLAALKDHATKLAIGKHIPLYGSKFIEMIDKRLVRKHYAVIFETLE